jgi:hypothetical protein
MRWIGYEPQMVQSGNKSAFSFLTTASSDYGEWDTS